jgi:hypothetical protein
MFGWLWRFGLTKEERQILQFMQMGWTLKSHRYLNGSKVYRLHSLGGEAVEVRNGVVAGLLRRGLLHSNQKFPAATFLLSDRGEQVLRHFATPSYPLPLTSRRFGSN